MSAQNQVVTQILENFFQSLSSDTALDQALVANLKETLITKDDFSPAAIQGAFLKEDEIE
jgi:hypothetical protein